MSNNTFEELVQIFDDPRREAQAVRIHRALLETMNHTHDDGEQDAMAVLEGFARLLAQIVSAADPTTNSGMVEYVAQRAIALRDATLLSGAAAKHLIDE